MLTNESRALICPNQSDRGPEKLTGTGGEMDRLTGGPMFWEAAPTINIQYHANLAPLFYNISCICNISYNNGIMITIIAFL